MDLAVAAAAYPHDVKGLGVIRVVRLGLARLAAARAVIGPHDLSAANRDAQPRASASLVAIVLAMDELLLARAIASAPRAVAREMSERPERIAAANADDGPLHADRNRAPLARQGVAGKFNAFVNQVYLVSSYAAAVYVEKRP
jgi:hypothetical protein